MTDGSIWKSLIVFFIPLLFGSFIQTLYSMVDAMMVGRFVGERALSAVGGTDYMIIVLYIGLYSGLATGANVVISQLFGAGERKKLFRTIDTAMVIGLIFGLLLGAASIAATPRMLEIMNNPADTMTDSIIYLRVYSFGIPALVVYNMGAGILRGLGDAKSPTLVLAVSSVLNIILDAVLILLFSMGVGGAAAATVIAQCIAAVWMFCMLEKRMKAAEARKRRPDGYACRRILQIGLPAALQSMTYSVANIITQVFVNGFGSRTVAAWAVFGKVDSVYWMVVSTFGIAVTTLIGQNYGAGKYDRVKKSLKQSTFMSLLFTAVFAVLIWVFARQMFYLFNNNEELVELGVWMARSFAPFYLAYAGIETMSAVLRGTGEITAPTVIMVGGICGVRLAWLFYAVPYFGTFYSLMLVYPVSWVVAEGLFLGYYLLRGRKKLERR
ncbi:MAG: MATE family efflux transporter [Lachnospiraceae bacterium]|nr:MATE family efflux transporter [Lachnospiraceae bacterium]